MIVFSHSSLRVALGHSGKLMINFFRPLHFSVKNEPSKTKFPSAIGEVYHNSAGFFHDFKKTWQVMIPIPLRHLTSVLFDLITLKTRPQELLMSDSEHFRECLRCNIGDFTFQEAFDRTGRILNITVTPNNSRSVLSCRFTCHDNVNVLSCCLFVGSDVSDMLPLVLLLHSLSNKFVSDPPRLLNYLTAPHCLVWSAAVASSSLPGKLSVCAFA